MGGEEDVLGPTRGQLRLKSVPLFNRNAICCVVHSQDQIIGHVKNAKLTVISAHVRGSRQT
jgi:hypothetical protein